MEKTEIQAVIKYFLKKGIHANFENTLGDSSSHSTVAKWINAFKFCEESLEDDLCGGRPKKCMILVGLENY
jgi:hypothetical protein